MPLWKRRFVLTFSGITIIKLQSNDGTTGSGVNDGGTGGSSGKQFERINLNKTILI